MIVKKETRQERDDVYSFWENKKVLNENEEIVVEEVKIEECTLATLNERIDEHTKKIAEINSFIELEKSKILLIKTLENG